VLDPDELARISVGTAPLTILEGEVADTARTPEPSGTDKLMAVRVPNPDGKAHTFGPLRWVGPANELPVDGDTVFLVQAANTRQWLAIVWPLSFDQPA
jgi:hypothetical protein